MRNAHAYERDGVIVVPDVFSPAEIDDLRLVTDQFVRESARVTANDAVYDLEDSHTPDEPRVRRLKAPHLIHPAYFRASRNDNVVAILKDLWGTVRFDTGKLNMKSAGYGAPVEWHQDWAFYPHTNDDLAAVGIMLDDVDMENGPMMVVPGSHKGPIHDHHGPNGRFCGAMDPADMRHRPVARTAVPRQGRLDHGASRARRARLGDEFLRPRAPLSAVPVPRRRRLAAARPQGRDRQVQRAAARRRAEPGAAPRAGAGAHAAAAGRASGFDLREPARQRPPLFRDRSGRPHGGGIAGRRQLGQELWTAGVCRMPAGRRRSQVRCVRSVMAEPSNSAWGPLQGVKIVACSTAQAGTVPYMLMADLGAEVIKIEVPEIGDNSRGSTVLPGMPSTYFETNNRGVKSVTLNLKTGTAATS